jgi:Xaa-Pro aminopeptidase
MRAVTMEAAVFEANRERLRRLLLPGSMAVLNANDVLPTNADGTLRLVPNSDLYYLTGISQEETILVLAPDAFDPGQREVLFLREPSAQLATWEGTKLSREEATRISGIRTVRWLSEFPVIFRQLMCEVDHVYLNSNEHQRAMIEVESRDARFTREVQRRYPLHQYYRLARLMHALRAVKSEAEIAMIRRACDLTGYGMRRVLGFVRPGTNEEEIEAELAREFIRQGGGFAYPPIIASGANSCVLHYNRNDRVCRAGEIVLLDVASGWGNYASDLTRTIPVDGRFTRRQRNVYDAVLRVFREMVRRMVCGKTTRDLRSECEALIAEECVGLGLLKRGQVRRQNPENPPVRRYFMHGVSHPIGLDVHDVTYQHCAIEAGWVLTCEPAIYVPDEGFGVRLENTILVTDRGAVDLMADIPIEADEIESLMMGRRRGKPGGKRVSPGKRGSGKRRG